MKLVIKEHESYPNSLSALFERGWGNGYVIIPKEHPLFGMHYSKINHLVEVHGGLTYSDKIENEEHLILFGLDKEDSGCWLVGFDTCHLDDNKYQCDKEYVARETIRLARQIDKLSNYEKPSRKGKKRE